MADKNQWTKAVLKNPLHRVRLKAVKMEGEKQCGRGLCPVMRLRWMYRIMLNGLGVREYVL